MKELSIFKDAQTKQCCNRFCCEGFLLTSRNCKTLDACNCTLIAWHVAFGYNLMQVPWLGWHRLACIACYHLTKLTSAPIPKIQIWKTHMFIYTIVLSYYYFLGCYLLSCPTCQLFTAQSTSTIRPMSFACKRHRRFTFETHRRCLFWTPKWKATVCALQKGKKSFPRYAATSYE